MQTQVRTNGTRFIVIPAKGLAAECNMIPHRVRMPKVGGWSCPASPFMAKRLVDIFKPHGATPDAGFIEYWGAYERIAAVNSDRPRGDLPDFDGLSGSSWAHQRVALHTVRGLWGPPGAVVGGGAALHVVMGGGKSRITVGLIGHYQFKRVLIVTVKRAASVWPDEMRTHGRFKFVDLRLTAPMTLKERADWLQMTPNGSAPTLFVTNYEALTPARGRNINPFAEACFTDDFDLVVLDESHKIKSPNGVISNFIGRIGHKTKYRLELTGTPMPQTPLDIYAQYNFLDPGLFGSLAEFKNKYVIYGGYEGRQIMGFKNTDELAREYGQLAVEVTGEVLDLEEPIHTPIKIKLDDKARKLYKSLEKEMAAEVAGEGYVLVSNSLTKRIRLRQITSGIVPLNDPEDIEAPAKLTIIDVSKAEMLQDLLEGIPADQPVVIFGNWRHDLEVMRAAAVTTGRRYMELSGVHDDLAAWQKATGGEVLGVQIRAGGAGVNLSRARYGVYYGLTESLGDFQQSQRRLWRPPQKHTVNFYYLLAQGTVDVTIQHALMEKRDVVEAIAARLRTIYNGEANEAGEFTT